MGFRLVKGGTVEGGDYVGGLFGYIYVGEADDDTLQIDHAYSDVEVISTDGETGGIIGEIDVSNYSEGNSSEVIIQDVYSWSNVLSYWGENVGGIAGLVKSYPEDYAQASTRIARVYSKGEVSGYNKVGGLIGTLYSDGDNSTIAIADSFSASPVTASNDGEYEELLVGALFGASDYAVLDEHIFVSNLYYDQARSGLESAGPIEGLDESESVTAVNLLGEEDDPDYFFNNTTNSPLDSWDFDDIWVANEFTAPTFRLISDSDNDGVEDDIENNAPNDGDGNNDGTPDLLQDNVVSLLSLQEGKYITIDVDPGCVLSNVLIVPEEDNIVLDNQYDYKAGLANFTVTGCEETEVRLYYHGVDKGDLRVRKYNPENETYFDIEGATIEDLLPPLNGSYVTYLLVDGGELDTNPDELAITDPVGLGSVASATDDSPNNNSGGSGSNNAGAPNSGLASRGIGQSIAMLVMGGVLLMIVTVYRKTNKG